MIAPILAYGADEQMVTVIASETTITLLASPTAATARLSQSSAPDRSRACCRGHGSVIKTFAGQCSYAGHTISAKIITHCQIFPPSVNRAGRRDRRWRSRRFDFHARRWLAALAPAAASATLAAGG